MLNVASRSLAGRALHVAAVTRSYLYLIILADVAVRSIPSLVLKHARRKA